MKYKNLFLMIPNVFLLSSILSSYAVKFEEYNGEDTIKVLVENENTEKHCRI